MTKKNRPKEEFYNVLTHGLGTLLAVIGLVLMVVFSSINGSAIHVVVSVIFGISMIVLYAASTTYHAIYTLKWKRIFQKIDHLSIYLLIAGTYTPVALIGLRGAWGWSIFGIIWGLVILGFIFKFSPLKKSEKLSLALYALMGWLIIVAAKPMVENLSSSALLYIVLGGLSYTFGIYFYVKDYKPLHHAIWHLFVMGGTIFHFVAIFFYILP